MESLFGLRPGGGFESLKRLGHISPAVQPHLKQVYLTLCSALAFSALGAYLHILLNVGGTLTTVGCLAAIAFLISLPPSQDQQRSRFALLMSAALLQGASVGPLVDLVLHLDPRILVTAFVGTAIAFGCFSGAAIIAKRREYLYLGGLLSSALSILLWLQFAASIFGHSSATFKLELYFGLLVFVGYMVLDTQEIIERAHQGDMDYIKHALTLFTDFVAVLVRALVIMLKNAQERSEEEEALSYQLSLSLICDLISTTMYCYSASEGVSLFSAVATRCTECFVVGLLSMMKLLAVS